MSVTHDMSGFVAHHMSVFIRLPLEVIDGTDRDSTGDSGDAI